MGLLRPEPPPIATLPLPAPSGGESDTFAAPADRATTRQFTSTSMPRPTRGREATALLRRRVAGGGERTAHGWAGRRVGVSRVLP
ncbi:hypothetical protein ACIRQQ_20170 [Streptomyces fuscichromogenes]|uniref:hypothetical protein n=1 Tax=Streptomyces fuscichromogenes TaxID=1324013 RepID=UPI0037F7A974